MPLCADLLIHILVFYRPNIKSSDHPLNTGSKSHHQDIPDKRRIKLCIPVAAVRASVRDGKDGRQFRRASIRNVKEWMSGPIYRLVGGLETFRLQIFYSFWHFCFALRVRP